MARRIHVSQVVIGQIVLEQPEAHHARDVLRLTVNHPIDVFDDAGTNGTGHISRCDTENVTVQVDSIAPPLTSAHWTVASAVPKGNRADWMIEKLSELGTDEFVPLITARSVVHPQGDGKKDRWQRIAIEAAKQCRRTGVMRIAELTPVDQWLKTLAASKNQAWYLSTEKSAKSIMQVAQSWLASHPENRSGKVTLLVGPEGGWTTQEMKMFDDAGLTPVKLTTTILRIETAAVTAAAILGILTADNELGAQTATNQGNNT